MKMEIMVKSYTEHVAMATILFFPNGTYFESNLN